MGRRQRAGHGTAGRSRAGGDGHVSWDRAWAYALTQVLALVLGSSAVSAASPAPDAWAVPLRQRMLEAIASTARDHAQLTGRAAFAGRVMAALGKVERHRFVPPELARASYENRPLPIGHGQTISQPSIVALMTDVLDLAPAHRVLEIGTGSGYQAAVLAELVAQVYTIEIVRPIGEQADRLLRTLAYTNVHTRIGDGHLGWPEAAPFDAIIVTAAAADIPPALIAQLKPGGRMVIPVGPPHAIQELVVVDKRADGSTISRSTLPVRFVPMTREK